MHSQTDIIFFQFRHIWLHISKQFQHTFNFFSQRWQQIRCDSFIHPSLIEENFHAIITSITTYNLKWCEKRDDMATYSMQSSEKFPRCHRHRFFSFFITSTIHIGWLTSASAIPIAGIHTFKVGGHDGWILNAVCVSLNLSYL